MIEVIAKRNNGFDNSFQEIKIKINDQEIILDAENSQNLMSVLAGKQGVMFHQKDGEYQPDKVTLFSCSQPFKCYAHEEDP
jgi:hypothetical protein